MQAIRAQAGTWGVPSSSCVNSSGPSWQVWAGGGSWALQGPLLFTLASVSPSGPAAPASQLLQALGGPLLGGGLTAGWGGLQGLRASPGALPGTLGAGGLSLLGLGT